MESGRGEKFDNFKAELRVKFLELKAQGVDDALDQLEPWALTQGYERTSFGWEPVSQ